MPGSQQPNRWAGMALLTLFVLLPMGCAYFNTFYNAKAAMGRAEKLGEEVDPRNQPTSQQRVEYQLAIRKSQLLLDEFPDSDLVDDALFVLGKAHNGLREFRQSERYLTNLLANFPGSDHREEALYIKSLAHLSLNEEQAALDNFQRLRQDYPDSKLAPEARYRLADAFVDAGRVDAAVPFYLAFLEEHPKHDARARVQLRLGRLLTEELRDEEAVDVLAQIERKKAGDEDFFDSQFLRARSLMALDRPEEAGEVLDEVSELAVVLKKELSVRLLRSRTAIRQGDHEGGLAALEELATQEDDRRVASEARLIIANHFLREDGPGDDRVLASLEAAVESRGRGNQNKTVDNRVDARLRQVQRFRKIQQTLVEGDSLASRAAFRLGELSLTAFAAPELALGFYRQSLVLDPSDKLAPRAAYAIAYLHRNWLDQPDSAETAEAMLRERWPDSIPARGLDGELFTEGLGTNADRIGLGNQQSGRDGTIDGTPVGAPEWWIRRSLRLGGPGALNPRQSPRGEPAAGDF